MDVDILGLVSWIHRLRGRIRDLEYMVDVFREQARLERLERVTALMQQRVFEFEGVGWRL